LSIHVHRFSLFDFIMSRREFFYAPPAQITDDEIQLIGDEHAHCARVLRKTTGDALTVVDGEGHAFDGVISSVEKQRTLVRITKRREAVGEPNTRLTLAQAVPKGNRFDWLIEKGTEVGVSSFIPLRCERSETTAGDNKCERWRRLGLAAMKQSCRSVLPSIESEKSFSEICAAASSFDFALLAEEGGVSILDALEKYRGKKPRGLVIVGPEGGFSEAELQTAANSGIRLFSLGPRRLRAETAGLVAVTVMLSVLGES